MTILHFKAKWIIFYFFVQSFSFRFPLRRGQKTSIVCIFESTIDCDLKSKHDNILSFSSSLEVNRYVDSLHKVGNQQGIADLVSKIIFHGSSSNSSNYISQNWNISFHSPIVLDRISCNMGIQAFLNLGKTSFTEMVFVYMQKVT